MKFKELKKFIKEDMRMAPGRLYQPIMIRTLIKAKNGEASKDEIIEAIKAVNPHKVPQKDTEYPWKILTKNHKVAEFDKAKKVYRLLDFDTYYAGTKAPITKLCGKIIKHGKVGIKGKIPGAKGRPKSDPELINKTILELPELIKNFDVNRKYFTPDFDPDVRKKILNNFNNEFPRHRIQKLQLDEYVAGKHLPNNETNLDNSKTNRNTFCWWIEEGTKRAAGFGTGDGKDFGILYQEKLNDYVFGSRVRKRKFLNKEKAFREIKSEISSIIDAGAGYTITKNQDVLLNKFDLDNTLLTPSIRLRILFLYFSEDILGVVDPTVLKICVRIFGFQKNEIMKKSSIKKQFMLLKKKNGDNIMNNWTIQDYSHFLYHIYKRTFPIESLFPLKSELYDKIMNYIGVK